MLFSQGNNAHSVARKGRRKITTPREDRFLWAVAKEDGAPQSEVVIIHQNIINVLIIPLWQCYEYNY